MTITARTILATVESIPETPGTVATLPLHLTPADDARFWAKVDKSGDCWEWAASKSNKGYGQFRADGKMRKAHRVAYTLTHGPIPEGLMLDHKCLNKSCVNPDHLRPVTLSENAENLQLHKEGTTSGVRGVCWSPKLKRWLAYASKNRRRYHAGAFPTIEEAAVAAREKRNELFTFSEVDREAGK